jgi:RNAse (barnase) inhibitor barstar
VYAISHGMAQGGERIEVFDVLTNSADVPISLKYKHSITSDWLNREAYGILNSIAVIEPNKFYVTRFKETPLKPFGEP